MGSAAPTFQRLGALKDVAAFRAYLNEKGIDLPCDDELRTGPASPLNAPARSVTVIVAVPGATALTDRDVTGRFGAASKAGLGLAGIALAAAVLFAIVG